MFQILEGFRNAKEAWETRTLDGCIVCFFTNYLIQSEIVQSLRIVDPTEHSDIFYYNTRKMYTNTIYREYRPC